MPLKPTDQVWRDDEWTWLRVSVTRAFHRRLKRAALEANLSISEYVRQLIARTIAGEREEEAMRVNDLRRSIQWARL